MSKKKKDIELINVAKKYNVTYKNKSNKQIAEYLNVRWRYMNKEERLLIIPFISGKNAKHLKNNLNKKQLKISKSIKNIQYPIKKNKSISKKNRNISIIINKNDNKENKENKKIIKNIKNKTNQDMIKELKNKGIYISGKSPKLLKDIYLYSLNDNIRIIKEL